MSESAFFLSLVLFFATVVSSLAWHVLIKGRGIADNLWLFFVLISNVFILSSVAATYFPFQNLYFFVAVLADVIFLTLYIYSFPHSVMPNMVWGIFISLSVFFLLLSFISVTESRWLMYFAMALVSFVLNLMIITRKIKYLSRGNRKLVMFHVLTVAVISQIVPAASAFSILFNNSFYFNFSLLLIVFLCVVSFSVFVHINQRSALGLNQTNFWLILLFSLPVFFVIKELFEQRLFMARFFSSTYFSVAVLYVLFTVFAAGGILISYFTSSIESFINKTRNYYQSYLNKYRLEIENITEQPQLFDKLYDCISEWFQEVKGIKFCVFEDLFVQNTRMPIELYEGNEDFQVLLGEQFFLHETYLSKDSSLLSSPQFSGFVSSTGGDFFIPVIYKNELSGFFAINSRKIAHNAMLCINNLIEMTLNKYERLSLFQTIIETEKKVEMLKHFKEVDRMLSFVAHELRSPMSSIMFNIEVVKDAVDRKKEIDTEYLDISLKELKRLNDTIEKMLVYGRNIKLTPYVYNFRSFFAEMKQFFSYANQIVDFADQTGGRDFVFDWDILKNVFVNLVNNSLQAIEKGDRPGKVKVTAYQKRKKLHIEVADNGPGIPPEHKDSVFEPFYTTKKNGNGLGLATCEKIVKLSGGSIVLKETSSAGTIFHISFPTESVTPG